MALQQGIDPALVAEVLQYFARYSYFDVDGETRHMAAYFTESVRGLWSSAESFPGIITMGTGCGAGGTLAGLYFNIACSKPIRWIRKLFMKYGLCVPLVNAGGNDMH